MNDLPVNQLLRDDYGGGVHIVGYQCTVAAVYHATM